MRVACVGDSITRGTFVWRRKANAYPAQLQAMLGDRFCVRNFGVNGHAVQRASDRPYWNSGAFSSSAGFKPDIVLIMLGTNDSRGDNWRGVDAFRNDYRELALHYRLLESSPAVWLLTPPALFRLGRSTKVRYGMDEGAIREMCGAIERLACDLGCGLIDTNAATAAHPEVFRFDGVHPGASGATLIAETVFEALVVAGDVATHMQARRDRGTAQDRSAIVTCSYNRLLLSWIAAPRLVAMGRTGHTATTASRL